MSLTNYITPKNLSKLDWLYDFLDDEIVITKQILLKFGLKDDEYIFMDKIKNTKIPFQTINRNDPQVQQNNFICKEMCETKKSHWYIMKTKNFKKALFLIGGIGLIRDLKTYYIELEDILRMFINNDNNLTNKINKEVAIAEEIGNNFITNCEQMINKKLEDTVSKNIKANCELITTCELMFDEKINKMLNEKLETTLNEKIKDSVQLIGNNLIISCEKMLDKKLKELFTTD